MSVYTNRLFFNADNDTGAAIAETLACDGVYILEDVRLSIDDSGAVENFTVTVDSALGAIYDRTLWTQATTTGAGSWRMDPAIPVAVADGDEIDFAWANTGAVDWSITAVYRKGA